MNVKLFIPMYFAIFEEICEYLVWFKKYFKESARNPKAHQEFLTQHLRIEPTSDFALLEVGATHIQISILFSERLIYLVNIENLTNVQNCQYNTPYVYQDFIF